MTGPLRKKSGPKTAGARRTGGMSTRAVLLLVAAALALFAAHAYSLRFTQDDAYISMRYAKNFVEGRGLVFNPGERVEGYTNFLWTLLLAGVLKAGLPIEKTASILGVAFGCGAILFAARLARALEGRWGTTSAAAALLLAANGAFALWCTGGLETGMFAFFVTAAFERGFAPDVSPRGRLLAPIFFVFASLTRPEGPLLFALWLALADQSRRERYQSAALFAGPLVLYAAWKLAYFGDLLPNTYYAKAGFSWEYMKRGLQYTKEFFLAYAGFGLAPALALYAAFGKKGGAADGKRLRPEARLLLAWIGFAAYVVWIGGDVLYSHRFWLPILPVGCVLVARGAGLVFEYARSAPAASPLAILRAVPPAFGVGLVTVALAGFGFAQNRATLKSRRDLEINFVLNMTQTGTWLGKNFPPGSTLAITTIGAVSYFSGLNVIDLLGLTDREIARNPKRMEGVGDTWREINYNAESVIRRRPDAIVFSTGVRPSSAAEKALFLYRDFSEVYYPYYFRSSPGRNGIQTLFRPRPGAGPPDLSLLPVESRAFVEEFSLGHVLQSKNADHREGAKHFEKSWELSGRNFRSAREWQGAALYDAKDPAALAILREVSDADPYAFVAKTRLADNALRNSRLDESAKLFEEIRALDPDDSLPWAGLSEIARLSGNFARARELAEESVRRWDSSPSHLSMWGALEAQAGELDKAKILFTRAVTIDPTFAPAKRSLYLLEEIRAGRRPPLADSGAGVPAGPPR